MVAPLKFSSIRAFIGWQGVALDDLGDVLRKRYVIALIENEKNIVTQNIGERAIIILHPLVKNYSLTLQWRHNRHDSVSNHQPCDCLLNRLFRRRSVTSEFPAQMASNTENVSIWWRHHGCQWSNPEVYKDTPPILNVIMVFVHNDDSKHWIVGCLSLLRYPLFTVTMDMHGV